MMKSGDAAYWKRRYEVAATWRAILGMLLAGAVLLVLLLLYDNEPTCGVQLRGDGTWTRATTEGGTLLDGCHMVVWDE